MEFIAAGIIAIALGIGGWWWGSQQEKKKAEQRFQQWKHHFIQAIRQPHAQRLIGDAITLVLTSDQFNGIVESLNHNPINSEEARTPAGEDRCERMRRTILG